MKDWPFWRAALLLLALLLAISGGLAAARSPEIAAWDSQYPWAFLRGGLPVAADEKLVEVAAAGDTNLGRGVDAQKALLQSAGWLRSADLAFINLECAIGSTNQGGGDNQSSTGPFRLIAPPQAAGLMKTAGIDVVGLANNHSLDSGPAGLEETVRNLEEAGVFSTGAGPDPEQALTPLVQTVDGVAIAFLAFNAVPSPDPQKAGWSIAGWEKDSSLAAVRRASILADGVVVSIHWGYEYERRADPAQQELAQALIAAGADLVIGHHPHVIQEVIIQPRADGSSGLAALSLGNFVFDQGQADSQHGLGLRAFFDLDGLRAVQLLPIQAGPQPRLSCQGGPGCPTSRLPNRLQTSPLTETLLFRCRPDGCGEASRTQAGANPPQGIFRTGKTDLTGDRLEEEIRLVDRRVEIYEQGRLAWTSPEEWRVLDLAVGDPDADGRGDLVLAMQKPDQEGRTQSHPFVIGYRGGVYRTVWGGSAVRDPVQEVELGDVDGDGEIELIVLEEERDGKGRAITIWHWHGWGFSLDWRSPYGQYEDMRLSDHTIAIRRLK